MLNSLGRYVLPSDQHSFVGRVYDLSIVGLHFETYEELAKHPDCRYAFRVNESLSILTRRIDSLNMVGNMLWPENFPIGFRAFPLSRYEWLTVTADVFLMRFISVVDCVMILINEAFECGLDARDCTTSKLRKAGVPQPFLNLVDGMTRDQGILRQERNGRFHHGVERGFSSEDDMFRIASVYEHREVKIQSEDGSPILVDRYFQEGLAELQKEFNFVMRKLVQRLDKLYDMLAPEFEATFSPRFQTGPFGPRGDAAKS